MSIFNQSEKAMQKPKSTLLETVLSGIRSADETAMQEARAYQMSLAKPPGSLGKLEDIAVRLAGITGQLHNRIGKKRIIVLCADNGVTGEGISSAPVSVTMAQAVNMTRHKTGMSCLARAFGCEVQVVDVGIVTPYRCDDILDRRIRNGTANLAKEPAMSYEEALQAVETGIKLARQAAEDGVSVVGVGEMGIGNTTTSSCVLSALTGLSATDVTGRGGGITDEAFAHKKAVVENALRLHAPDPEDPVDVLSKVGGLDLAAMCGVFLGCAERRLPVVIDGFISITAALCAARLAPDAADCFFPSHVSQEIGYLRAARELSLSPWLHLDMRLGEGSGCPLAFEILHAACVVMNDMATFEEAAINDDYLEEIRKGDKFSV